MDIKVLIEQVRSQLDGEVVEKVNSVLKEIETGTIDVIDSLKAASSESKGRKIKIRELEEKVSDFEMQVETLSKDNDKTELLAENERLKTFKADVFKRQRESFKGKIDSVKTHANFERAAKLLKLPEPDKDGEYDFSNMQDSDFEFNIIKLSELDALDYFGGDTQKKTVHGDKTNNAPVDLKDKISEAKSVAELEAIQDSLD